ncbi:protein-L-isoaspartate O-methyltransferase family protein [Chitinimonas koreensis]|uniref:protein-L-isoaspartate O-methyltransferase family protein n=1 Tax=Chitinimonas koreensis TaxID=356302 RepID=UPI0003FE15F2|nr:protein-L-isoaspartate O-methyltransferase [Chitinimonas koreensis]QNM97022.1 protein-L-isoaspartate O-methyltransferase [Chitinimonas koreensis]
MDWENARYLMVEQQIRPWDVLDLTVLSLLSEVKREDFVPAAHRELALIDMEIPLGNGSRMWQPKLEARAVQEVGLTGSERVLEIGTGAGYLAALLGKLAKHVYSVEIDAALAEQARGKLAAAGIDNVTVETGDAARGWSKHAPYDVIVAAGSYPTTPDFLFEQLAEGGRLFAIVGEEPVMSATLFEKKAGAVSATKLFETVVAPLQNVPQPERFSF